MLYQFFDLKLREIDFIKSALIQTRQKKLEKSGVIS